MSRTFIFLLILCSTITLRAQTTIEHRVHFDVATDRLNAEELTKLIALCELVEKEKLSSIAITGHADVRGGAGYNHDLSAKRGKAVQDLLIQHCGFDVPVSLLSLGESCSKAVVGDEAGLKADRRVNIEFIFRHREFSSNDHRHSRVRPLMPMADVPREHFVADASRQIEFIASDGVRVRIAPDAIVHADGTHINGEVDITYRSFNNTSSIIASGIPIHVGTGADAGHMESRGMFEIYASKEGERLFLKEGEGISLTLPEEMERSAEYKDWMLDEATGDWMETPSRNDVSISLAVSGPSEACARYDRLITAMPAMPDTTVLLERMESIDYCGSVPCSPAVRPYDRYKKRYVSPYATRNIPGVHLQMIKNAYSGRKWVGFKIQVDHVSLREWRAFPKDMIWAYDGPLDRSSFRREITRKHFYQDVVLKVDACGTKGRIMLKDRGEWITLPVDLSVHQAAEKDLAKWNAQLATYEKAFEAKRVRFDDRVANRWRSISEQRQRTMTTSWQQARKCMNDDELSMTLEEFHDYAVQANSQWMAAVMSRSPDASGVTSSFVMNGFGIYNCDRILPRESIQPVFVELKDENDQPFNWTHGYAVLAGQKAVITYWGSGTSKERDLKLSRKISKMIFVDTEGALMIVYRPTDQIGNTRATIKGRRIEQPKGPDELAELLATAR